MSWRKGAQLLRELQRKTGAGGKDKRLREAAVWVCWNSLENEGNKGGVTGELLTEPPPS